MCGQCSLENQLMIRLLVITLVCSGHDHLEYHDHHVRDDQDDHGDYDGDHEESGRLYITNLVVLRGSWRLYTRKLEVVMNRE